MQMFTAKLTENVKEKKNNLKNSLEPVKHGRGLAAPVDSKSTL